MNVTCDKCSKKYVISDDKVAGKSSVKIRCKQCQNLISIAVSASSSSAVAAAPVAQPQPSLAGGTVPSHPSPWADEVTRAAPMPIDMTPQWYAMIAGKQHGPFDLIELQRRVHGGEVTVRTYMWKAGMADWKRAADVPDVSPLLANAPAAVPSSSPSRPPPTAKPVVAAQRDVAMANEVPTANKPTAQNGEGAVAQNKALGDLFSDVGEPEDTKGSTERTGEHQMPEDGPGERTQIAASPGPSATPAEPSPAATLEGAEGQSDAPKSEENPADPFAALSKDDGKQAPPPGEATRFFIAQAGVNKRNPPWKIALFALAFIGGPIALVYILNTFQIVKLPTVTTTDENGEEVQESFFSANGAAGLRDMLTGDASKRKSEAEKRKRDQEALAKAKALAAKGVGTNPVKKDDPEPEVVVPKPQDPNVAAFYQESEGVGTKGPKVRKDETGNSGSAEVNKSGLSPESVSKVLADKSKAFQACIDTALRRTPNLSVGSIVVVLTVAPSGVVKAAGIDPKKHETTEWGQCMMSTGKRIIFPGSDAETQVEVPFKVGTAITL